MLIAIARVTMSGGIVLVEIILLHVFAVIAFPRREAAGALFQYGIAPVPQRKREHQYLVAITPAGETIRAPAPPLRRFPLVVLESSVFRCVAQRHGAATSLVSLSIAYEAGRLSAVMDESVSFATPATSPAPHSPRSAWAVIPTFEPEPASAGAVA